MTKATAISHITYRAWDVDKSFDFFVNVLGFYPQRRANYTYVGVGDTLIEIGRADPSTASDPQDPNRYIFGVEVEDIEATIADLETHGIKVVKPIWSGASFWGRQVVIDAPGGPQIALREYRSPDGPHFTEWKAE